MVALTKAAAVTHMLPRDMQESNERLFSKKHISKHLDNAIRANPDSEARVMAGVDLLNQWIAYWAAPMDQQTTSEKHYASKNARLTQLADLDMEQLVRDIYIGVAYEQAPALFVGVTAQLATRLGFNDRRDAILTVAEMVAVLAHTKAHMITKAGPNGSLMIQSCLDLPAEMVDCIRRAKYLPPMVCEPEDLTGNYESPFLTHNDCLVLGKQNGRLGDLCLDVINTQNQTALKLDLDFISTVEEELIDDDEDVLPGAANVVDFQKWAKAKNWRQFKVDSYNTYHMLAMQGNKFWLPNKVDNRIRLYALGYHVTTQGSGFKKACIELYNEEVVEGVPT
jgi:hypothetical protein